MYAELNSYDIVGLSRRRGIETIGFKKDIITHAGMSFAVVSAGSGSHVLSADGVSGKKHFIT